MTIKSDRWIKQMALEHGMIEPFEEQQVRQGVVSYGLSSYGYDIRVADEFKIFTSATGELTVVDPKHFDPKGFKDFQGSECIIPPNSFALARTVEYFRIPRDVLTVCVGKCLTGDTRVIDAATGDYRPIRDFVDQAGYSTMSLDRWQIGPAQVSALMNNGRQPVYELTTWSGLRIKATANHPFRTFEGWTSLADLRPGDRIAVARTCPIFGTYDWFEHEAILLGLMLADGQCNTPGHSPRYTTGDPRLVEVLKEAAQAFGCEVSPVGKHSYNVVNHLGRGGISRKNRVCAWLERLGCNKTSREKSIPSIVFKARKERVATFLRALFSGDGSAYQSGGGVYVEYATTSEQLAYDVRHLLLRFGIFAPVRSKQVWTGDLVYRVAITDRDMIRRFAREIGFIPGSRKQQALQEVLERIALYPKRKSNFDMLPAAAWKVIRDVVSAYGQSLRSVGIVATPPKQSLPYIIAKRAAEVIQDEEFSAIVNSDVVWDRVTSITYAGIEPVYDITVPELHNFVANDIIVHNSTYARCFRGDTRVALVDGTAPTLEEMAERSERGEHFWGYSVGPYGRIIVALLENPRYIGRDSLVEITLDTGEPIFCTPDHLFLTRDGRMVPAHTLRPVDSLMPLYRQVARGYEMVYQPLDGHLYPTHRLSDEWNLRHGLYQNAPDTHRHHIDHNRRNNRPWNITRMDASEHIRHHNQASYGQDFDPDEHGAARLLNCDRSVFRRFPEVLRAFKGRPRNNHKVAAIHELPGDHDVYCLTVPETGNFALEAGIFVRNCGIIVNITPFEPEWEGYVTLEISNTTPLPAKIYANEGIAQVLFFQSDEPCMRSYRDKQGKYQNQQGLTLPKL